jgi:hypothetical protein
LPHGYLQHPIDLGFVLFWFISRELRNDFVASGFRTAS